MPKGKPNILVIWGDDIGISNLSCYSHGLMGYNTPNIDRLANEGMLVPRLLRGTVLHRRSLVLHHRSKRVADRPVQGRDPRRDQWAATFKEFPPIQKPNSFTIYDAIAMLREAYTSGAS